MYIHNLQIREASSCRPANGAMSSDGVHTERWDVFLSADEENFPLWEEGAVAMCECKWLKLSMFKILQTT